MEYVDRDALEVLKEIVRKVEDGTIDDLYIFAEIDYDDPHEGTDEPFSVDNLGDKPTGIIGYSIHTHEVNLDTVNKMQREYQLEGNAKQVRKEKIRRAQAAHRQAARDRKAALTARQVKVDDKEQG